MTSEHLSIPLGVDLRGRGMTRHRNYLDHQVKVLWVRLDWWRNRLTAPTWDPKANGCRTVLPLTRKDQ